MVVMQVAWMHLCKYYYYPSYCTSIVAAIFSECMLASNITTPFITSTYAIITPLPTRVVTIKKAC